MKERVFSAAEEIATESGATPTPTVALVRVRAQCSNADATRYLREWRSERAEHFRAEANVPAMPAAVDQAVRRSTTTLWSVAVQAARAEHDAALAAARASVEESRAEADSLAAQADETASVLGRTEIAWMTQSLEDARAELEEVRAQAARGAVEGTEQLRVAFEDARATREASTAESALSSKAASLACESRCTTCLASGFHGGVGLSRCHDARKCS
nr:DNA-binding protein [Sanguibacter antarcticus]